MKKKDQHKPTVGLFGVFHTLQAGYSIANVAAEQARMLVRNGYRTVLLMTEDARPERDGELAALTTEYPDLIIRYAIPCLDLRDYLDVTEPAEDNFDTQVNILVAALRTALKDVDVVFTHDVMAQTWHLPHNAAVRRLAEERPELRWAHWAHSAPSFPDAEVIYPHNMRFMGMRNSKWVYLNHVDVSRLAQMRNVWESDVYVVQNPRDICDFLGFQAHTKAYVRKHRLLDAEVLIVYPTRMSTGKQPDKAVRFAAALKSFGRTVKLLFINSYSTGDDEQALMQQLTTLAHNTGLGVRNVLFTSKSGIPEWRLYCPQECVRDLMQLSDLFILPSLSESNSLITLEAAMCRCLCVLNEDFTPMWELLEHRAMYAKFSSTLIQTGHQDEQAEIEYYKTVAARVIHELQTNKVLASFGHVKRRYNADKIFKQDIEPLIYL